VVFVYIQSIELIRQKTIEYRYRTY